MAKQYINVATEYSETPGSRYESEGPFSGEQFRREFLVPKLYQMESEITPQKLFPDQLVVDLDGGAGYGVGWLDEVFAGLIRDGFDYKFIEKVLHIQSDEEPYLIDEIWEYMYQAAHNEG